MNTEIIELKQELMISRQQNEILELKYRLQKTQAEKASRLDDSLLSPELYGHYQKVAVMLSKSGIIPNAYRGKPEDIFVAMAMGYQLGFPVEQSLQDIAVVNGRPCLWGDGLLSLALNHPDCQSIDEEPLFDNKGNVLGYRCTVIRRGHKPHTKQFTLQDASVAGLLSRGTVWKVYPERMLQMRARSFAIRDKFADALRGLRIAEIEEEDSRFIEATIVEPVPEGKTQVEKLKNVLREKKDVCEKDSDMADSDCHKYDSAEYGNDLSPDENYEHGAVSEAVDGNAGPRDNGMRSSPEQLEAINTLLKSRCFSEERIQKALNYYKVSSIEELTNIQAISFLSQLERAQ